MSAAGEAKPSRGPKDPAPREMSKADAQGLRMAGPAQGGRE
jgi:hypothetical protein